MKREIVLGDTKVSYTIRVSGRARYLRMTVGSEGLVVTVPTRWHVHFVEQFLRQKASWILKHLSKAEKMKDRTVLPHSKKDYEANKEKFLAHITGRVEFFNSLYQYSYRKISIRNQTSLWGSCTRAGSLQFNFKLSYLPQKPIDYVVVHELCHLREHNHSERFWKLVARMIPDYKIIRKSLHQYILKEG
jgi:predicted metal-dependent hydrolase